MQTPGFIPPKEWNRFDEDGLGGGPAGKGQPGQGRGAGARHSPTGSQQEKKRNLLNKECWVCGAPASEHIHYGAICCYSCRAFFRRSGARNYQCIRGDNQCEVNTKFRKYCKKCRYRKCLDSGMKPELVDASLRNKEADMQAAGETVLQIKGVPKKESRSPSPNKAVSSSIKTESPSVSSISPEINKESYFPAASKLFYSEPSRLIDYYRENPVQRRSESERGGDYPGRGYGKPSLDEFSPSSMQASPPLAYPPSSPVSSPYSQRPLQHQQQQYQLSPQQQHHQQQQQQQYQQQQYQQFGAPPGGKIQEYRQQFPTYDDETQLFRGHENIRNNIFRMDARNIFSGPEEYLFRGTEKSRNIFVGNEDPRMNLNMLPMYNALQGYKQFKDAKNYHDSMERMGPDIEKMGPGIERMGPGMEEMAPGMERMGPGMEKMGPGMERIGPGMERMELVGHKVSTIKVNNEFREREFDQRPQMIDLQNQVDELKDEDDECQTGLCAVEDMKGDAVDPISNNIFNVQKVISQQQQNHRISVIQLGPRKTTEDDKKKPLKKRTCTKMCKNYFRKFLYCEPVIQLTWEEKTFIDKRVVETRMMVQMVQSSPKAEPDFGSKELETERTDALSTFRNSFTGIFGKLRGNNLSEMDGLGLLESRFFCCALTSIAVRLFGGSVDGTMVGSEYTGKYAGMLRSPWACSYEEEEKVVGTLRGLGELIGGDEKLEVLFTTCIMRGFQDPRSAFMQLERGNRHTESNDDLLPPQQDLQDEPGHPAKNKPKPDEARCACEDPNMLTGVQFSLLMYRYLKDGNNSEKAPDIFKKLEGLVKPLYECQNIFYYGRLPI